MRSQGAVDVSEWRGGRLTSASVVGFGSGHKGKLTIIDTSPFYEDQSEDHVEDAD